MTALHVTHPAKHILHAQIDDLHLIWAPHTKALVIGHQHGQELRGCKGLACLQTGMHLSAQPQTAHLVLQALVLVSRHLALPAGWVPSVWY